MVRLRCATTTLAPDGSAPSVHSQGPPGTFSGFCSAPRGRSPVLNGTRKSGRPESPQRRSDTLEAPPGSSFPPFASVPRSDLHHALAVPRPRTHLEQKETKATKSCTPANFRPPELASPFVGPVRRFENHRDRRYAFSLRRRWGGANRSSLRGRQFGDSAFAERESRNAAGPSLQQPRAGPR